MCGGFLYLFLKDSRNAKKILRKETSSSRRPEFFKSKPTQSRCFKKISQSTQRYEVYFFKRLAFLA